MKRFTQRTIHYLTLLVITGGSLWTMVWLSRRSAPSPIHSALDLRPLPLASLPKAPVAAAHVAVEMCEITATFAGKIRPWENYRIAFEVAGRVSALGESASGAPLDEGDRVAAGQILARLDDRVFRAQRSEAVARLEQAASDLQRDREARGATRGAVSESQLQQRITSESLARAQLEAATKNLEDAVLRAPVDAVVSRRMLKAGESVNAHETVLELVQNDDVLLVVNVPESQIRELEARRRQVEQNPSLGGAQIDPEDRVFRAHVRLEGSDRFGDPWPQLDGEVYRIAEVAHPQSSLFEVEVRLANTRRLLRPGMVATAEIVTQRLPGYRLPTESVIFRQNQASIFSLVEQSVPLELLYWELGPTTLYRAHRVDLPRWVDQGEDVVVPAADLQLGQVVTRGQHRLADGQLVRPVRLRADAQDDAGRASHATNSAPDVSLARLDAQSGRERAASAGSREGISQ